MGFALACFVVAAVLKTLELILRKIAFWITPIEFSAAPVKAGWEQDEPWPECFDEMEDL